MEQRLAAAAEEIFGLFERTMAEYEEELSRSKEGNDRGRTLLDAVFKPQLRLHRAGLFSSVLSVYNTCRNADASSAAAVRLCGRHIGAVKIR